VQQSIIQDIQGFDGVLREIAAIDTRVAVAEVSRKEEILVAEGRFKARTDTLLGRRGLLVRELELYYRAHRAELEKGKKSVELQFGSAGIKTAAPAFKLLRGWTWARVLDAIRDADLGFIRSKETVDKQALKKACLGDEKLSAIGVKVSQPETFWFETKPQSSTGKVEAAA